MSRPSFPNANLCDRLRAQGLTENLASCLSSAASRLLCVDPRFDFSAIHAKHSDPRTREVISSASLPAFKLQVSENLMFFFAEEMKLTFPCELQNVFNPRSEWK